MMRIKFAQRILTHLFNRSSLTTALPPFPWPDCFSVINRKGRGEMSHALPLRTSNCQALPTAYSNCPNCWTLPTPHRAKSTITRHEIPPVSTMKSSIPLPNTFHISPVCCSVPCCFSPEQKQPHPPPGFSPPNKSLCEVCCAVWLCGISWLPAAKTPFHPSCTVYRKAILLECVLFFSWPGRQHLFTVRSRLRDWHTSSPVCASGLLTKWLLCAMLGVIDLSLLVLVPSMAILWDQDLSFCIKISTSWTLLHFAELMIELKNHDVCNLLPIGPWGTRRPWDLLTCCFGHYSH